MANDRAIEPAGQFIITANVLGQGLGEKSLDAMDVFQALIGDLHRVNGILRHEIEAIAKVDNSADHIRVFNLVSGVHFASPFNAPMGIGFPEIYSRPNPIMIVFALLERRFATENGFACLPFAPVITEGK